MKVPTPIVTLLVGVLIAVIVAVLSARAKPEQPTEPYGAPFMTTVTR
ncbi:MAG: hypothetical protein HOU81_08870 [Hamadaea sp.]|nr:hypothetical protein [Hamadaea sp.]NUR70920.1 hypothetical protein [Hamadaea sp.]NUT21707.1 hypothetical protein [Hamadaea sp.]